MIRIKCLTAKKKAAATGHAATTQVTSAIAAGIQCQEAVKCLHNIKGGSMKWESGRKYLFDGEYNAFRTLKLRRDPECRDHFRFDKINETPIASDWTLERTLEYVRENFGEGYFINAENDGEYRLAGYIDKAKCLHCRREITVGKPIFEVGMEDYYCPDCRGEQDPNGLDEAELVQLFAICGEQAHLRGKTLHELGFPYLHILVLENEDMEKPDIYLEMTGDLERIMPNLNEKHGA